MRTYDPPSKDCLAVHLIFGGTGSGLTGVDNDGRTNYYEGGQPILRVENMEAALRFYVGALGFSNATWGTDDFTSVNRDRAGIYLCPRRSGPRRRVGLAGVNNVEIIYEDLKQRGVPIRMAPTNYPWALEMQVEDPDGNVLRIGSRAET